MTVIGLLGGTFDPVHCGHLRTAIEIREAYRVDRMYLLPASQPRLRSSPHASAEQRLALLRAATAEVEGLAVDAREMGRTGETRTVDTLEALRCEAGATMSEASLVFVLGMDAFERIGQWHQPERILELAHLVVVGRPGTPLPSEGLAAKWMSKARAESPLQVLEDPAGRVFVQVMPGLEISSTGIRERIAAGRSIQYLVPAPVRELIEKQELYKHAK